MAASLRVRYEIQLEFINTRNNELIQFSKTTFSDITVANVQLLYNNDHVIEENLNIVSLFAQEIQDYCIGYVMDFKELVLDSYEVVSLSDNVDFYFAGSEQDPSYTLQPNLCCYIYPVKEKIETPILFGRAHDTTTIIWTIPNEYSAYSHYIVTEPLDVNEDGTSKKIIATLPLGEMQFIETGLTPNTAYTRRLINFNDEGMSLPSPAVTVMTEKMDFKSNLFDYTNKRNEDWVITDDERMYIAEGLDAFHSGIGDIKDCMVYKQSDKDFYEKFRAYFVLSGTYTNSEPRYDQVSFYYRLKLEALQTIQRMDGECTFKLDVYPWQELYLKEYLWGIKPLTVRAKAFATVEVFNQKVHTYEVFTEGEYKTDEVIGIPDPALLTLCVDLSGSMDNKYSNRINTVKTVMANTLANLKALAAITGSKPDIAIVGFARYTGYKIFPAGDFDGAIAAVQSMQAHEGGSGSFTGVSGLGSWTSWEGGLQTAANIANTFPVTHTKLLAFFSDGAPNTYSNGGWAGQNAQYTVSVAGSGAAGAYDLCQPIFLIDSNRPDPGWSGGTVAYAATCCNTLCSCFGVEQPWTNYNVYGNVDALGEFMTKAFTAQVVTNSTSSMAGLTVKVPVTRQSSTLLQIESEEISFTFDNTTTPTWFNTISRRAEIHYPLQRTPMSSKSIGQLLKEALDAKMAMLPGYDVVNIYDNTNKTHPVGAYYKNVFIQAQYPWADEDRNTFYDAEGQWVMINQDSLYSWGYGQQGSIDVYCCVCSTVDNAIDFNNWHGNLTNNMAYDKDGWYESDTYTVPGGGNYIYISGYTDAIIFDGVREAHANVNGYKAKCPWKVLLFKRDDVFDLLKNRMTLAYSWRDTGLPVDSSTIFKRPLYEKMSTPSYLQIINDGIDDDEYVKIDEHWESPVLNYKFDIDDPNTYLQYYEILPDCDKNCKDPLAVVLTVYYGENVYVMEGEPNGQYFSLFDVKTGVSPWLFEYGLESNWDIINSEFVCNGKHITDHIEIHSLPKMKTVEYTDILPPEDEEPYYGQVNGRYTSDNITGKQDLVVDAHQFNIPSTVDKSTVRIYCEIEEALPEDALVEYKWDYEFPAGSGYTNINGDVLTFSSESPTMRDIIHTKVLGTYNTEEMEIFNQHPYETIQEITRPVFNNEEELNKRYTYETVDYVANAGNIYEYTIGNISNGFGIDTESECTAILEDIRAGVYEVHIKGNNGELAEIRAYNTKTKSNISCSLVSRSITDHETIYRIIVYNNLEKLSMVIANNDTEKELEFEYIDMIRTSGNFEHYYIKGYTNNADVIITNCQSEVMFTDSDTTQFPVTYLGVVSATSKWNPRIHNGYYYFNQHENFIYSEFECTANFEKKTVEEHKDITIFVLLGINIFKDGGSPETYDILKDTKAELLQDERHFRWVDNPMNGSAYWGLTLNPVLKGKYYEHYEAKIWYSPAISFGHILTTVGPLTIDYINTDGTNTGLEFKVRYYINEKSKWQDWEDAVPFTNGTIPLLPESSAYQVCCELSATEDHYEYEWDDYLCCQLDWTDYIDLSASFNITTATDYIKNTANNPARVISRILDQGCPSNVKFEMFTNAKEYNMTAYGNVNSVNNFPILFVAYSNSYTNMLLGNINWEVYKDNDLRRYRYWRFRIDLPVGGKLYWVHITCNTLKSDIRLPYIKSVSMLGSYEPVDITDYFENVETFDIPADGLPHEIMPNIGKYINADLALRGYEQEDISQIEIKQTLDNCELTFNNDLLLTPPNHDLIDTEPIFAQTNEEFVQSTYKTPFIYTDEDCFYRITIDDATPQQYCPVTVEDVDGNTYKEIFDIVDLETMKLKEEFDITEETNHIALKRTDFEFLTLEVFVNDVQVMFNVQNHLLFFKEPLKPNDKVVVTYNVLHSFYTVIDREANRTQVYIYDNKDSFKKFNEITQITTIPYNEVQIEIVEEIIKGNELNYDNLTFLELDSNYGTYFNETPKDNSWTVVDGKLIQVQNHYPPVGFVENTPLINYSKQITLTSSSGDDDEIGCILGYVKDVGCLLFTVGFGETTLQQSAMGVTYYDFVARTKTVLWTYNIPWNMRLNWNNKKVKATFQKSGNQYYGKIHVLLDNAVDINFNIDMSKINNMLCGDVKFGYETFSQPNSIFEGDIDVTTTEKIVQKEVEHITVKYKDEEITTIVPIEHKYKVKFETNLNDNKFKTDLSMNPAYRTEYEGFIYITDTHNHAYKINIYATTHAIERGGIQTMDVNIEVLDILNNPVINHDVTVECTYGTLNDNSFKTDENGVVHVIYTSSYYECDDIITVKAKDKDDNDIIATTEIKNYDKNGI